MYSRLLKDILAMQEAWEPGDYADKKKPTYGCFSGVGRYDECEEEPNKMVRNRTMPVTVGLG